MKLQFIYQKFVVAELSGNGLPVQDKKWVLGAKLFICNTYSLPLSEVTINLITNGQ